MRRPSASPWSSRSALAALAIAVLASAAAPAGASAFGPLSSFGQFGAGPGQFTMPLGIVIAADGTAYVTDFPNQRVAVFGRDGAFLFAFGKDVNPLGGDTCTSLTGCNPGTGNGSAGAVNSPEGIALGPEGNLFVVSQGSSRVDVFDRAGTFLFAFGKKVNPDPGAANTDLCTTSSGCRLGEAAISAGGLSLPSGIGFDSAGHLFVAEFESNRVSVFNTTGTFLFAFGKSVNPDLNAANPDLCTAASGCQRGAAAGVAGAVRDPLDVAVAADGNVFVGDFGNNRVDVFNTAGTFLFAFGKGVNPAPSAASPDLCTIASGCVGGVRSAAAGGFEGPSGVAIDAGGSIYVADNGQHRISQFSAAAVFIRAFGTGVLDGADAFQICTLVCQAGTATPSPGSIPSPVRIAVDCRGAVYTTTAGVDAAGQRTSAIKRFGEPGTAPCGQPVVDLPVPSNKFTFGRLTLNKRRGTAVLFVSVPGPGRLLLKGKGIRTVRRAVRAAGKVRLPINPTGKAKRALARTGTIRLKAKVTFTPTGGTAATQVKTLRLKRLRR
jgi:DNA-binding beta-propeller fold protein YncE